MSPLYIFFELIRFLCYLFSILILLRALLSWVWPRPTNTPTVYLYRVTEPFLMPLRRIVPRVGMVDFTPLLAIVILQLIALLLP